MAVDTPQRAASASPAVAATVKPKPTAVLPAKLVAMRAIDMAGPAYLRALVMGWNKVGKSTAVISTAPGPVYVINSDGQAALEPVLDFNQDFLHTYVKSSEEMNQAFEIARQLVKAGEVKTVVWDTMSGLSPIVEAEAFKQTLTSNGKEDGRKAAPLYKKVMRTNVKRLFNLKAHVVVYLALPGHRWAGRRRRAGEGRQRQRDQEDAQDWTRHRSDAVRIFQG